MKRRPKKTPDAASPGMKPTHQIRSAATRDRILSTIEKALREDRLEALTVQDIVREADCSIGAFYGRFDDKDAALAALFSSTREAYAERILQLSNLGLSVEEWARKCAQLALNHALDNRALLARAAAQTDSSSQILSDAHETNTELSNALAELITTKWLPKISKEQANSVAAFVLVLVGATTRDMVIYFSNLLETKSRRRWFTDQLTLAVCGYVRMHDPQTKN